MNPTYQSIQQSFSGDLPYRGDNSVQALGRALRDIGLYEGSLRTSRFNLNRQIGNINAFVNIQHNFYYHQWDGTEGKGDNRRKKSKFVRARVQQEISFADINVVPLTANYETNISEIANDIKSQIRDQIDTTTDGGGAYPAYIKVGQYYYGPAFEGSDRVRWWRDIEDLPIDSVRFSVALMDDQNARIADLPLQRFTFKDASIGINQKLELKNLCVPESLFYAIMKINKSRNNTIKMKSINEICNDFKKMLNLDTENIEDTKKALSERGITSEEIMNWSKEHIPHVSVYIIDPTNKVFLENKVKDARGSIHIKINNDHAYLITDPMIKKSLVQLKAIKQNKLIKEDIDLEDCTVIDADDNLVANITQSDKKYVIIKENSWQFVIHKYIQQSQTMITNFNSSGEDISCFECPKTNKIVIIRPEFEQMERLYKQLNEWNDANNKFPKDAIKYRGMGLSFLAETLKSLIIGNIPKSRYNKRVLKHLDNFKRPSLVEQYRNKKEGVAIDIFKCDSFSTTDLLDDIPVYDIHDTVEIYRGDEIKCGMYQVKPFQMWYGKINCPNGWYSGGFVKKCLDAHIIQKSDIVEQYLPMATISKDIFKGCTKFIFDIFEEADAKAISNSGVGMYGKKYRKKVDGFFTNSHDVANAKYNESKYYPISFGDDLYFCRKIEQARNMSDHRMIYNSIIDRSIWQLYELVKEKCNDEPRNLYGIKRDCIYGRFDSVPELKYEKAYDALGKYRPQAYNMVPVPKDDLYKVDFKYERKTFQYMRHFDELTDDKKYESKDRTELVNLLLEKRGCVIGGGGGFGKSFLLNLLAQAIQNLEKHNRVLVITPTNSAMDNLKKDGITAQTIHTALTHKEDNRFVPRYNGTNAFEYDYILVDEAYNMSTFQVRLIYNLYLNYKIKGIYFFGDKEQIPPCEKQDEDGENMGVCYDYDKSQAWIDMCKYQYYLQYISESRYDLKLKGELDNVLNNKTPNIQIMNRDVKLGRFIAKTNITVDNLNKRMMRNNDIVYKIPKNKVGSDSKLTQMKLTRGSPVMPYKKGEYFYNNQELYYDEEKEGMVYLKTSDNKTIFIPVKTFTYSFVPAYCITAYKSQSKTFKFKYGIFEVNKMTKNDLYVALSRANKYENVYISEKVNEIIPYKYKTVKVSVRPSFRIAYIYKIDNTIKYFNYEQSEGELIEKLPYCKSYDVRMALKQHREFLKTRENVNNTVQGANLDKMKGITEDKTKFKVRRKGIKAKTFSFKKCGGRENALKMATEYLLNGL